MAVTAADSRAVTLPSSASGPLNLVLASGNQQRDRDVVQIQAPHDHDQFVSAVFNMLQHQGENHSRMLQNEETVSRVA